MDKLLFELHATSTETDILKERIRVLEEREQQNLEQIKQRDNKHGIYF